MGLATGIGVGIQFSRGGGVDWASYWATRTPSNLKAEKISPTQINLTWDDPVDATPVKIYISTDNINFAEKGTAIYGTESFSVTGLNPHTLYYFYVVGYSSSNVSSRSNIDASLTYAAIDADGNCYNGIVINDRLYLVENLKTTKYNDGSSIPTELSNANWALEDGSTGHDGAFAQVNNDSNNKAVYGLLYNWLSINNAKGLCPAGFHVTTSTEIAALREYVGGASVAGGKLKEYKTTHWQSPNTGADDYFGFKALPAGQRNALTGANSGIKQYGVYHCGNQYNAINSYRYYMAYNSAALTEDNVDKRWGFSVKCISDTPTVEDRKWDDNTLTDIFSPETAYGEPTALVSSDGLRMDIWFGIGEQIYYSYTTDGTTFATPVTTNIPLGYMRSHALLYDGVYYMFASIDDNSIHLFSSTNRIAWTDLGQVLAKSVSGWDSESVANTFVWHEGDNWYMLYEGSDGISFKMGLATSSAINGPWTRYASNPVLEGSNVGNIEMPRVNNEIIKHAGKYYLYFHQGISYDPSLYRAYSVDLHTWIIEGKVSHPVPVHTGFVTWADCCLAQFKGKSYLFFSPSNQVDAACIDVNIDNRELIAMLALPVI